MKKYYLTASLLLWSVFANAQSDSKHLLPVRALCIAAPQPAGVDTFVRFIAEELAPRNVNVLILRVDFGYEFKTHPELVDENPLSKADVEKLVTAASENNIQLIPHINLLGHQSWDKKLGIFLRKYPQFDETPNIKIPEPYTWPNSLQLYCKSYCPLHPEVHNYIFAIMDELCDVFKTNAFHAGMDEVLYLGEDDCTRCKGKNKAELFAGEVKLIRDHLAEKKRKLWIWGDRLVDAAVFHCDTMSASGNQTAPAIDLIPKDVTICDWRYYKDFNTEIYFAEKGFDTITCNWKAAKLSTAQTDKMYALRKESSPGMQQKFKGMMLTVWGSADEFVSNFQRTKQSGEVEENTTWNCFRVMFAAINRKQ